MAFSLPPLPYPKNALAPHISEETLEFHYGKHHQTYVTNLNNLLTAPEDQSLSLEQLIVKYKEGPIFNNAAQVFNHTFYWNSLSPQGGGEPEGRVAELINANFGSFAIFKEEFTKLSLSLFGSGWTWLVMTKDGKLAIRQKPNAGTPLTDGEKPLLTCDVWEHAYYIDARNARAKYMEGFWRLLNWNFVAQQLES
jgi:Fe-Mn family superoxide dismutase